MKLLALDTATECCSAALWVDGDLAQRSAREPRAHARLILPMIDELLAAAGMTPAELDGIAYGRGPGAFTGVRLAVGVAQGLAFGAGLPVIGVSDLAALAHAAHRCHGWTQVIACLDARMGEVYCGRYRIAGAGRLAAVADERVEAPASVECLPDFAGVGHGWRVVAAAGRPVPPRLDSDLLPSAVDIAWLGARELRAGRGVAAAQAQPVYLRDRVAERPKGPRGPP